MYPLMWEANRLAIYKLQEVELVVNKRQIQLVTEGKKLTCRPPDFKFSCKTNSFKSYLKPHL